ncbi:hypothetical protein M422DRAFT_249570 [Sphaerobolus stellatus SS14]|uniref:Uncharacterized protein n=1 Tax=Sphaerobolus stellatus (strain SS14) TaxID=990650 RepID=A0A0C9VHQ3_SPHS4|nr:hypothetical protein M422DRAFT_249570 [Sphaerobolus stellatus SS14]
MEEVPADDLRRTVWGFEPDKKFDWLAPKFAFDDPFKEEEDHLPKVTRYWKAHDQERTQCESRYCELLGAEEAAASRKRMEEDARALKKVQEEELEKKKGKEKEKEVGPSGSVKGKGKETWPSGNAKGKAKEVPKTPKKSTPKKSKHDVQSESEEEEEEVDDKLQACIYCMKKKIPGIPQDGKKEGAENIVGPVRELTKLEWHWLASLLEKSWYDMDICALNLEQMVDRDLMEVDSKVLTLMDMKSRRVEIPPAVEKRILANWSSIIASYTSHMEHIFMWMNLIQKCMAWTKNEFPDSVLGFGNQEAGPSDCVEDAGNKRKAEEDGDCAEGSDNKKRRLEEEEDSTMY